MPCFQPEIAVATGGNSKFEKKGSIVQNHKLSKKNVLFTKVIERKPTQYSRTTEKSRANVRESPAFTFSPTVGRSVASE